jgi:hypothetical protein
MQHKFAIAMSIHQLLVDSSLRKSQTTTLTFCVLGLMMGHQLSLSAIGTHMPGKPDPKHNIKKVDRWCGNTLVDVKPITRSMLVALGKQSGELLVSVDWTKIDNFQALVFAVTTGYGRAVPIYWEIIDTDEERMKAVEVAAIDRFHALVPQNIHITILADRGFDEVAFIRAVDKRFDYVIRLSRSNTVSSSLPAATEKVFTTLEERLDVRDQPVDLGDVLFTKVHRFQTRIVGTHALKAKEPWFLATSLKELSATDVICRYARRFDIEHAFKDWKDCKHGWKLGKIFTKSCDRLSRLLIIAAVAYLVLVLVGLVGESRNKQRGLQSNTTRDRRQIAVWQVGRKLLNRSKALYLTVALLLSFLDSVALQGV